LDDIIAHVDITGPIQGWVRHELDEGWLARAYKANGGCGEHVPAVDLRQASDRVRHRSRCEISLKCRIADPHA